ncbi:MAG: alcohol dehydrogenase catalytic domain-containing protein [Caldilineaceae bacterium]
MNTKVQFTQQRHQLRPATIFSWPLRGSGLENLGVNGAPVAEPFPICSTEQILVRVDAVGLCSSDGKIIRMGRQYPLLYGRDLTRQPIRQGHEVALTIIEVGERWRGQYQPGQRLGIQPDIFVNGQRTCLGVLLPGGFTQYMTLGPEILAGDDGAYVFPIPPGLSYTEIALLEPYACVEASFVPRRRLGLLPGGTLWINGRKGNECPYQISCPLPSARVILTDVPETLAAWVRTHSLEVIERNGATVAQIVEAFAPNGLADIILLDPRAATLVEAAADALATQGTLTIVSDQPLDGPVHLDASRIHYEFLGFMGCTGSDIAQAWGAARNRSELRKGGVTLIAGAGGPMGRIVLQRTLQMVDGPHTIIVTNRGVERLQSLLQSFAPLAAQQGRQLIGISPSAEPARLARVVAELTHGRGCDDVVVVPPNPALMGEAAQYLAPDGLFALFAGVPLGNKLGMPVSNVYLHNLQITGTSGSTVGDQQRVIDRILAGELAPMQSVAAIGGLKAIPAGLQAVMEQRYAGKVVIFPQLLDLPLLHLSDLRTALPAVYANLGPDATWSSAAERALFAAEI